MRVAFPLHTDVINFVCGSILRLWHKVSEAVIDQDMHMATTEKHKLEEKQRTDAKERHKNNLEWVPKWFTLDPATNKWVYKHVE